MILPHENQAVTVENPQASSMLSEEETKQILTPFAFNIDKSLFGLPLSVPWKRGIALLIDFSLIALLADTPGEILALLIGITFFQIGSKKRAKKFGQRRGIRKLFLRIIGVIMMLIVIAANGPDFVKNIYSTNEDSPVQEPSQITSAKSVDNKASDNKKSVQQDKQNSQFNARESNQQLTKAQSEKANKATDDNASVIYKGIEWAKGVINDLGLSFGWAAFYFTVFTAMWNGQTPGKKLLKIRVIQLDGTPLSVWDSFGRYGGYGAGLATGLLGFLQIYWDPNRQAIHDKISATVVIDLNKLSKSKK